MTEQQQHLQSAIQQQKTFNDQLSQLTTQSTQIRDNIVKLQGVIEYLTQIGVTIPTSEEVAADFPEVTPEQREEFEKRNLQSRVDRNPSS